MAKWFPELLANMGKGDLKTFNKPVFPKGEQMGVGFHEAPRGVLSHWVVIDSGKIKILAMLNKTREESTKQYPLITESKQLKDFDFNIWTGYFVKKETPEPIVQVLHKAITDTLSDPTVHAGLEASSQLTAKPLPLAAVGKAYADGTAQFRAIAKSINLQAQ